MVVKPWEAQPNSTKNNPPSSSAGSSAPAKTPPQSQKSDKKKAYRYPFDRIDEGDDYLLIEVIDFVPGGLQRQSAESFALVTTDQTLARSKQKVISRIILPIPEGVGDSNNADWSNSNASPVDAALMGAFNQFLGQAAGGNLPGEFGKMLKDVSSTATNLALSAEGQKAFMATAAAKAATALTGNGNAQGLINRAIGATLNPNSQMLFNSVSQRSFGFSWDLVPRSKKESDEIKEIIRVFKSFMAARKGAQAQAGGGFFIGSPSVFQLTYMTGQKPHAFLNQFKPMALTGMSVNYTGSGTYATYSDSTPVHMQLTLNMSELTPIYAEDYDTEDGKTGVGY